jgi:hypothetical protein
MSNGFDLMTSHQLALLQQAKDKGICEALSKYIIRLLRQDAASGHIQPLATGFYFLGDEGIVCTAGRVDVGNDQVWALFSDGTWCMPSNKPDPDWDFSVLQMDRPSLMPRLPLGLVRVGDDVGIVGFPQGSAQLHCAQGTVTSKDYRSFVATAFVDSGAR